tara:strand:+ start:44 stop:286 length:243 start_codon:yes stop_codon:yes gene_type:complete
MNKGKFKEICVDVFRDIEESAFEKTKQEYTRVVADKLCTSFSIMSGRMAMLFTHEQIIKELTELIEESFDEMLEKQNENS